MAKFQTKDWISALLYLIATFLIALNHFKTSDGIKNDTLEMSGWIMMIIASLYSIFANIKRVTSKEES